MNNKTRKCGHCKVVKSITEFPREVTVTAGEYPGVSYVCKECHKKKSVANRVKRRLKGLKEKPRDPLKKQSRRMLYTALEAGRVKKDPCFFCGEKDVAAHHLIYAFPLHVIWVCRMHHSLIHFPPKSQV